MFSSDLLAWLILPLQSLGIYYVVVSWLGAAEPDSFSAPFKTQGSLHEKRTHRGAAQSGNLVSQLKIPSFILAFFIVDLGLGAAYVIDSLAGRPYWLLSTLLDLGGERNVPTWYASVQWFLVAVLLAIFAYHNFHRSQIRSWLLPVLPLPFLAFSLDEIAEIYERLGRNTDVFLPYVSREGTFFFRTGIWMFVIGVPFLVFFAALIFSLRVYFRHAGGPLKKMLFGMAVFLSGALAIEALSNFVVDFDLAYGVLQVVSEEVCEMLGSTIILWGSYELLDRHGFVLRLDEVQID